MYIEMNALVKKVVQIDCGSHGPMTLPLHLLLLGTMQILEE